MSSYNMMVGIGVIFERFVFQVLEAVTVRRWGMVAGAKP